MSLVRRPFIELGTNLQSVFHMHDSRHLFVSGLKRSGTTLLQLVLSAHPRITVTPEAHFPCSLSVGGWSPDQRFDTEQLAAIIDMLRDDTKLAEWPKFELENFVSEKLEGQALTVADLFDALLFEFARVNGTGTTYIGNKKGLYSNVTKRPGTVESSPRVDLSSLSEIRVTP